MIILSVFIIALLITVIVTAIEISVLIKQKPAQELPCDNELEKYSLNINGKKFEELYLFLTGEKTHLFFSAEDTYEILRKQSDYIGKRFDCSDFRTQLLFKLYKDCGDKLNEECRDLIKKTFLDFKYFMDEPGDDSMCYWSENHQILFAVSEYLAGQEWQNEIFTNNGMTGIEHMQKAKIRIDAWMQQRFDYGFSEYLSNNYLAEDISPMANYIAYSQDKKSVDQMKIIMDILWLDVALNSVNNRFVSTSSRMYGNNKAGNFYGNSVQSAMNILWGREAQNEALDNPDFSQNEKKLISHSLEKESNYITICFNDIVKKGIYNIPEAIKDIALYKENFISKMGCGLSVQDLKNENLIGQQPHQIMAQMGTETFTNPEVINNTIEYLDKNEMYRNSFVGYFRFLKLSVLRFVDWQRFAAKFNIMPHGIATGRGNVYTYRTPLYVLSTSVAKDVDMCGAQEHIWSANISENVSLFTTHPSGNGNGRYSQSPGYWIGNGRRPMSVQHKNINITIYKIPDKKRLGEVGISSVTHAYMPKEFYDEFILSDNTVFARKNGVFLAMISNGELTYRPFNKESAQGLLKYKGFSEDVKLHEEFDLCRSKGRYHIYITELSDENAESFEEFKSRIIKNSVKFSDKGEAVYASSAGELFVSYDGIFKCNGVDMPTEYDRYDSKFCKAKRIPDSISIDSGKNKLFLDFKNAIRY